VVLSIFNLALFKKKMKGIRPPNKTSPPKPNRTYANSGDLKLTEESDTSRGAPGITQSESSPSLVPGQKYRPLRRKPVQVAREEVVEGSHTTSGNWSVSKKSPLWDGSILTGDPRMCINGTLSFKIKNLTS
jgi:hypothetical protein